MMNVKPSKDGVIVEFDGKNHLNELVEGFLIGKVKLPTVVPTNHITIAAVCLRAYERGNKQFIKTQGAKILKKPSRVVF